MIVVVNTSPLIILDKIGCIDILKKLFNNLIRPAAVLQEIQDGHIKYGKSSSLADSDWLKTVDNPPEMHFRKELGSGETAAIALACKLNADLIILDDLAARNVAIELGLRIAIPI